MAVQPANATLHCDFCIASAVARTLSCRACLAGEQSCSGLPLIPLLEPTWPSAEKGVQFSDAKVTQWRHQRALPGHIKRPKAGCEPPHDAHSETNS